MHHGETMTDGGTGRLTSSAPMALLGAAGAGAALLYFLDAGQGARRRRMVADRVTRVRHRAGDALDVAVRDLRNRATGVAAGVRSRVSGDDADDRVVAERVRAELGRLVSHPGSIEVVARDGTVTLTGSVLAVEVNELLARVRKVRGVEEVDQRLDIHESAEGVPELQGGVARTESRSAVLPESWPPGVRLLAAVAGTVVAIRLARRCF